MDFSICDNMVGFPKYSHIFLKDFNEHKVIKLPINL